MIPENGSLSYLYVYSRIDIVYIKRVYTEGTVFIKPGVLKAVPICGGSEQHKMIDKDKTERTE